MSRRLSIQYKISTLETSKKPKVKFPDELVFLDSIKDKDIDNVRTMLRRASLNIDINKINLSGLTALHQAVLENSLDVVTLLVDNKADVNAIDADSWTPLHAACSMGFYDVAKYLLEKGADANALTEEGERPIDLIEESEDNFALISLLLNNMKSFRTYDNDMENDIDDNQMDTSDEASSSTLNDTDDSACRRIILAILKSDADGETKASQIESSLEIYSQTTPTFFQSSRFVPCLILSIFELCSQHDDIIATSEFKDSTIYLLVRYLDSTSKKLECLNLIYDWIMRTNDKLSPQRINDIKSIFFCIKDSNVISKELFETWKNSQRRSSMVQQFEEFLSF